MKAVVIENFGGIEVMKLEEMPNPQPDFSEVQIRVHYAGINPVDWKVREGLLKDRLPSKFPIILGWDASGVIESVGEGVKGFKKGDEVYTYCRKPVVQAGTFAEYVVVDERSVALKPKNIGFAEASAIPLVALTAWQSLFDVANLKEGDTVLVQAGAGGVGSFAIQFAKWKNAKVYTTASEKNHAYVKSLGSDVQIDYSKEDFAKAIFEKEANGLDVVFDCVGGRTLRESLPLVKKGGCVVSIVNSNVEELSKPFDIRAAYVFVKPNGEQLKEIAELIESQIIKPAPIEEFLLEDVEAALEQIKKGHTKGKLVLRVI